MKVGDLFVGKSLIVGDPTLALTGIGRPPVNIRGTAYVEAPMIVGDDSKFPFPEATMMIPGTETPQDVVIGDPSGPVGVTVFCGTSMFSVQAATINLLGLLKVSTFPVVTNVEGILSDIGSKVFAGAKTEAGVDANLSKALNAAPVVGSTIEKFMDFVTGATTLNKTFGIAVSKKSFDISHPTKENHRLRYVCLEGPSAEVYVRGKLRGSNKIELPEYWKGLVDPDSITVTLTPIGTFQELFYEEVEWCSTIKVMNAAGGPVNCSYTVFAERKDTSKNVPEYQGLTPLDYPGDNDEYRL